MLPLLLMLALAQVGDEYESVAPPALSLLPGGAGQSYLVPDPCASIQGIVGGFHGPNGFCAQSLPDAGFNAPAGMTQVDGGALVTFSPGAIVPAQVTQRTCNNGPNCANTTFQRFDGGTGAGYTSANIASPTADVSCVVLMKPNSADNTYVLSKFTSVPTVIMVSSAGAYSVAVYKTGASTSISAGAGTATLGTWNVLGLSYHYVADGSSLLTAFVNGASAGTPSTTAVGPPAPANESWGISGYWDNPYRVRGDIAFAACSEANWTAAQHLAIARATVGTLTGSYGETVTTTRTTAYSCSVDDSNMSQLPPNRPCVVAGAVKVRPQVINRGRQGETLSAWTAIGDAGVDVDVLLSPRGDLTADRVVLASGATTLYQIALGGAMDAGCTPSFYLQGVDAGGTLIASNAYSTAYGSMTVPLSLLPFDGGWLRVYPGLTGTTTTTPFGYTSAGGCSWALQSQDAGVIALGVWGASVEDSSNGAPPKDYCGLSLASAVTCGPEMVAMSNPLFGVNPSAYCLTGRIKRPAAGWSDGTTKMVGELGSYSTTNAMNVLVFTNGNLYAQHWDSAATYKAAAGAIPAALSSLDTLLLRGCLESDGYVRVYADGALVATSAAGVLPIVQPSSVKIGYGQGNQPYGVSDFAITSLTMPMPGCSFDGGC
jgi:hypothetical protein